MKHRYISILAVLALLPAAKINSQIMYSNGATIFMAPGSIVNTNGGLTIDVNSTFTNQGNLLVTKLSTFPLPGTFTIDNGSTVSGDGYYKIEQDWINNATFTGGNSTVELFGNTQEFITSTNATVTTFNNLTLTGTGVGNNRKKTLQAVNARVGVNGVLNINDRELETQTNTFFVDNTNTAAVLNNQTPGSEGFVSSLNPGTFSRATNSANGYLYPTGSSVVLTRYRPVVITPNAANADIYTVRFINHNPDWDGFNRAQNDGLICTANDTFYHAIDRTGGADFADIMLHYIPASDGPWSGMSHWKNASTNWNDMNTVNFGVSGVFTTMDRLAWQFATPGFPYVLTDKRPSAPTISCPTVCENSSGNIYFANDTSATGYVWTVPGNGTIIAGQGTDSVFVDWTTGSGYVTVYATSPTGCNSVADSCFTVAAPAPNAAFFDTSGGMWNNDYTFFDLSGGGVTSWNWNFGDGNTSTQQNPTHNYGGAGTYTVILTVQNSNGCIDTVQSIVTVMEGIIIPNVFTPNGDGTNDEFYIANSGLKEYHIEIYDRWGVKIFQSDAPAIHWDGRSTSGQMCTDGTYYYVLHAVSDTKDYSTHGFITLIGGKK